MASKTSKKKIRDLRHPITYKRENGKFDVEWYTKHDKKNWVLPKVLKEQAKKLGKKPFLQFGNKKPISFYQTNKLANKVANGLIKMGIKKGDEVAVYMPNSDDYVITWFGILKMGAVMVPINTGYKMDFLQYILDSSDSIALFIAEEYLERMPPIAKKIPQLKNIIVFYELGILVAWIFGKKKKAENEEEDGDKDENEAIFK